MSLIVLYLFLVPSILCFELKSDYNRKLNEIINIENLSKQIESQLNDANVSDSLVLTLKMIDASTKIPSGLMTFNFFDLGDFDECYDIHEADIYGKYCLGTLSITPKTKKYFELLGQNYTNRVMDRPHPQLRLMGLGTDLMGWHWAACIPSSMRADQILGLMTFTEDLCYTKANDSSLSAGAIATIVILAVFLALIVACTIYDIFLYYTDKECPHELLIAFSILSNGRKIFSTTQNQDQLLCLNGIKAISMMWVLLGHEYSSLYFAGITNMTYMREWQQDTFNMIILGATVSVDTFFVAGGLVTVYTFLKSMDKGAKFNVILYYVHRYIRLTPALAIVALVYLFLLQHLGNGPLWAVVDKTLIQTCERSWWSTLLYISNYVHQENCVPQTWYLSVDMQLFVLSPLVLFPLKKWPKKGLILLEVLAVAGVVVPFIVGYTENLGGTIGNGDETSSKKYMNLYYIQTYARFGPYVIGMIVGYLIYLIKKTGWKPKLSPLKFKLTIGCLWIISLSGLVACVYASHDLSISTVPDRWGNALFLAFNRPAWAVALGILILLCVVGYGGPINTFLSLPIFQFLSKVSYSMYLVHYSVIVGRYSSMKNLFKFSNLTMMHYFWGDFMFTLALSLLLCLSFESPIIIIEKYLFGRGVSKPKQVDKKPEV